MMELVFLYEEKDNKGTPYLSPCHMKIVRRQLSASQEYGPHQEQNLPTP